ncbi:MAG: FAD-binding protein, partial [Deltaproteobacteria bacterium]|nr:FAD-binding protein [Deltaproteobacteria bacterium]
MSKAIVSSRETDVAVVGYGGAGATAAITAADLGAKVLIVEKAASGGGNTRLSAGSVRTFGALDRAVEHITFLCGGATDPEVIETLVRESHDNEAWLRSLGGEVAVDPLQAAPASYPVYPTGAASPEQPGADGVGPRLRVKGETTANGRDLWELL